MSICKPAKKTSKCFRKTKKRFIFALAFMPGLTGNGEMAEWSNAPVLKTGEGHTSGGSNPSFSAEEKPATRVAGFLFREFVKSLLFKEFEKTNEQTAIRRFGFFF